MYYLEALMQIMAQDGGSEEGGVTFTQKVFSTDGIVVHLHSNHTLQRRGDWLHGGLCIFIYKSIQCDNLLTIFRLSFKLTEISYLIIMSLL